jgi:IPT/TIG domain-containing protein
VAKFLIQLHGSFRRRVLGSTVAGVALIASCSSGNSELASRRPAAAGDGGDAANFLGGEPAALPTPVPGTLPPIAEHAVLGVEPAHGPFQGGQVAVIRGNGFSSQVRVWFGDLEVPADQVTATRADRVQVVVPAGSPGSVTVTAQNGELEASRASLDAGYHYDAFFAQPDHAPESGGSTITLIGAQTAWDTDTVVQVDQAACEVLEVRGEKGAAQELDCRLPQGTEGQKSIAITTGDTVDNIIGAFSYEAGAAIQGGLSGAPLSTTLTVVVTAPGGAPVPGAYVILGSDIAMAELDQPGTTLRQTDASGTAVFDADFAEPQLVTVAARCFQPRSFVGVPVDTLRAELSAVASPDCGDSLPNIFGGSPVPPVVVRGELVWRGGVEFQRSGWSNVPAAARADERRAAYVFEPSGDPEGTFRLPRMERAITLETPGLAGYQFETTTGAGSRTFYALAGVENRTSNPPRFTAYAMGIVRGLFAAPGETIEGIAIPMNRTLDQALTLNIDGPVASGRGPDHIDARVAVQLAEGGFVVLPNTQLEASLPGSGSFNLVGVPALVGDLEGSQYAVSARASTGLGSAWPLSVVPVTNARVANQPVAIGDFVPVPTLTLGTDDQVTWNRQLAVAWSATGRDVALVLYELTSGAGLITWSVVAPPNAGGFTLPDLSQLPEGGLLPGALDVSVSLASLPDFEYAALSTADLGRFAWEAYASDVASTRYGSASE